MYGASNKSVNNLAPVLDGRKGVCSTCRFANEVMGMTDVSCGRAGGWIRGMIVGYVALLSLFADHFKKKIFFYSPITIFVWSTACNSIS